MKIRNFLFMLAVIAGTIALPVAFGCRVNITSSMPLGIYHFINPASLHRGDIAIFCLESEEAIRLAATRKYLGFGRCPGGLLPLIKTVIAVPGDHITFAGKEIVVNGNTIPNSTIQHTDSHGRKLASNLREGVVPAGKVLMLSTHNSKSFDSRYFGLIPLKTIEVVEPIITF